MHPASLRAVPGRYRLLTELGRGGMGAVFLVFDEVRCECVALTPTFVQTPEFDVGFTR